MACSAHSFIYDFGGIRGQGYFAIFDGHAGKHAAEWCGVHFHEVRLISRSVPLSLRCDAPISVVQDEDEFDAPSTPLQHLLDNLRKTPTTPVPDLLNSTFHLVDTKLSELAASENTHSGCTAAVVFLRLEEEDGTAVGDAAGVSEAAGVAVKEGPPLGSPEGALKAAKEGGTSQVGEETVDGLGALKSKSEGGSPPSGTPSSSSGLIPTPKEVKSKIKSMLTGKSTEFTGDVASLPPPSLGGGGSEGVKTPDVEIKGPAEVKKAAKKTLYTANVGDARAVLACVLPSHLSFPSSLPLLYPSLAFRSPSPFL